MIGITARARNTYKLSSFKYQLNFISRGIGHRDVRIGLTGDTLSGPVACTQQVQFGILL